MYIVYTEYNKSLCRKNTENCEGKKKLRDNTLPKHKMENEIKMKMLAFILFVYLMVWSLAVGASLGFTWISCMPSCDIVYRSWCACVCMRALWTLISQQS